MYYLRKKPYTKEYINSETGEKYYIEFTEDRAIFKHNQFGRMYRKNYLCTENGIHLWKCKLLQNALRHRVQLYHYCNEWFDIYDDTNDEPISPSLYEEYKASPIDIIWTTKTLYLNTVTGNITDELNFDKDVYKTIRKGSKLKVYNVVDYNKLSDSELLNAFDGIEDSVICVDSKGNTILEFAEYQDLLNCKETSLFEDKWDRKWRKEGKL